MADQRDGGISWTDETWSPVTGCSHASPGCINCYAERMAPRLVAMGQTKAYTNLPWTSQNAAANVRIHPDRLEIPLRWKRARKIFVCSMADLFHQQVGFELIAAVFGVMAASPQHIFQILTKRSERLVEFFQWLEERGQRVANLFPNDPQSWRIRQQLHAAVLKVGANPFLNSKGGHGDVWPLRNVWVGVSVEDQRRADERIPNLLMIPAAVRWLSVEPLLGPVDLTMLPWGGYKLDCLNQRWGDPATWQEKAAARIDQVIVGGESGPNSRPMHPDWARMIRDQCVSAGVPFHFKQWGEWAPWQQVLGQTDSCMRRWSDERSRLLYPDGSDHRGKPGASPLDQTVLVERFGKHAAGRLLDGRTWDEFPTVAAQAVPA